MKVLATSKSLEGLVERMREIFGTSFVEVKGELMDLSIRGESKSDLRVRKGSNGVYRLEDRSLPTIQVPIRAGFETRPYIEVPGCDAIVITIYKQDESLRYTPTVKINGYAIAHVMKTKAAAIEWCKWVWKHLPEADRTLRVKDPDKAYKGVLEPEGAREVMKLARRMSDENWSATRIKATASPLNLPSGGETQSDLRVRKYPKGAYKLEDRSLPTIQVPIRTGFETRPYLEVPGCDAIVVTIYKQDESLRYTPTVKINGYAIAHVMKTKAAAIEWCKWVWKHLPEADRTLRVKDPDKAYKGVLEPEGAREVMKLARRMSDENWSATRIKKTASPVTLPSGGSYWAKKYREGKAAGPDTLLLFRSGDFFELFFDDAKTVAKMLGITLTTRSRMDEEPIPMAGFPVYQAEAYINKLIKYGFRVAVMEG